MFRTLGNFRVFCRPSHPNYRWDCLFMWRLSWMQPKFIDESHQPAKGQSFAHPPVGWPRCIAQQVDYIVETTLQSAQHSNSTTRILVMKSSVWKKFFPTQLRKQRQWQLESCRVR